MSTSTSTSTPDHVPNAEAKCLGAVSVPSKTKTKTKLKACPKAKNARQKPATALFHEQLQFGNCSPLACHSSASDPIEVVRILSTKPSSRERTLLDPENADLQPSFQPSLQPSDTESLSRSSVDSSGTSSIENGPDTARKLRRFDHTTALTLDHFAALASLQSLIEEYGQIAHMGVLDPGFSFFMNNDRNAALCYKINRKIAVVGGDPLCHRSCWSQTLTEFAVFRKKHGLGIAFLGASKDFEDFASQQGWVSMRWGTERALNPMTNKVLAETQGKRIVTQVKQLIRAGTRVDVYIPYYKQDTALHRRLFHVYEAWKDHKNKTKPNQAYMTDLDPFALPSLMVYVYTSDTAGNINGLAALRRTGKGYHMDPYCFLPDAPRGISELLIFSTLSLLKKAGVSFLGLGFEPAPELSEFSGLKTHTITIVKAAYQRMWPHLSMSGKKAFYDKWYPDAELDGGLYNVYPDGQPGLKHSLAVMHFSNICVRGIARAEIKAHLQRFREKYNNPKSEQLNEPDVKKSAPKPISPYTVHCAIKCASETSIQLALPLKMS